MQPGANNRSKSDMCPMPPHRQFKALHRPFEATHRQPNTASKCKIARERCPKATNREAVGREFELKVHIAQRGA